MVNILSEALDELYPIEDTAAAVNDPTTTCIDALQAELEAVRNQSHTGTQRVRSINTVRHCNFHSMTLTRTKF